MAITKFVLIDATLLLIGLSFLFIIQGGMGKSFLLGQINGNKLTGQTSTYIPSLYNLLELERLAKREGSEIEFDSLIGIWKFESVWKQGIDDEDSVASSLLRLFSASLELRKHQSNEDPIKFDITNSIRFGLMQIRFVGSGELKGTQPRLPFFFERIEFKLGARVLLSRSLTIPDENNRPFFSLIGIEESGKWLAARGRGGGLALWLRE